MHSCSRYSRVVTCGTELMDSLLDNVTICLCKSLCIVLIVTPRMSWWTGEVCKMRDIDAVELWWGNSTAWKWPLESLRGGWRIVRHILWSYVAVYIAVNILRFHQQNRI